MMRCALALLLCLTAGMAAAQSAHPTTITLWGTGYGPETKGFEAVIREFERRNPDIRVRVLSMGAGKMNPQKLMTAIVGNVAPDVILQDRLSIGDWASRGAFRSLNDFLERDASDPLCPKPSDYYPATWQEATFEGKVYAVPTTTDNRVLYYNRAHFKEAGLDPDRPPRTWPELLDASKKLTKFNADGTLKRAGFIPNFGNAWLYIYAFQNNASFMSADGKTCTLGSPEAVEALTFMVQGYDLLGGFENCQNFQSGFLTGEYDAFISGKVSMKIDGDWILKDLSRYAARLDFGAAPGPVPDDRFAKRGRFTNEPDTFVTWAGGFSYAIPNGAKHADAGWRFIKFATSLTGRQIEVLATADWEKRRGREFIPRLAAHKGATEWSYATFKPRDPRLAKALAIHIDMAKYGRTRPVTLAGQRLWDEHVRAIEKAGLKSMTPAEALQEGQRIVQRELDAYYSTGRLPTVDANVPIYIAIAIAAGIGALIWTAYRRAPLGAMGRNEAKWGLVFITPWLVGFLVFSLVPMVSSLFYSFTSYNVLHDARWVGFQNYVDLTTVEGASTAKAFSNALYLAGIGVPLGIVTGLTIALLLNAAVSGMRIYRTLFYLPSIVPVTASAVLWAWLLTSDPNKGLVNAAWKITISEWFGTAPPGWLNAEAWAKPSLIMMGLWGAGSGMLLWLAGLKGISSTLYEAASIDGASPWRQFWSVTIPQLSPIIFFNTVMGFIGALQEFDRVYIMKPAEGSAGPNDSLLVPVYSLFQNGFGYFKMGYASAIAWAIFALILGLTLVQFRLKQRWVYEEVDR
jgi:ABC-type sugar transport system permease subunit/ABC-type glycerol-3-phosphate transport system substrate-binding protein